MKNLAIKNRVLQRDRVLQRRVLERYYCTVMIEYFENRIVYEINETRIQMVFNQIQKLKVI